MNTADKIDVFKGNYRFLSNFYISPVTFDGIIYPTVEHAYQAAKTLDIEKRKEISRLPTPAKAKSAGKILELREDWEDVKIEIMKSLLSMKFKDKHLKNWLIATGDAYLEEGNWWGDTFWGVCKGQGENHLGKLLMQVREEVKK